MRQTAREGIASAVNELAEGLRGDADLENAAEDAREKLVLLLERDAVEADTVEHHNTGSRVRVKFTRGDSPRDEDEWTVEGRGASAEEAAEEFDENLNRLVDEWGDVVRGLDFDDE